MQSLPQNSLSEEENIPPIHWAAVATNVALVAAIIVIALHFGETREFVQLLTHIKTSWLLIALALQGMTYACVGGLWRIVLKRVAKTISLGTIMTLSVAKVFIDQAIPSMGLSGNVMLARSFIHRNIDRGEALAAILVESLSRYGAYLVAFIVAITIMGYAHALNPLVRSFAELFLFTIIFLLGFFTAMTIRGNGELLQTWGCKIRPLRPLFSAIKEAPREILNDGGLWAGSLTLQIMVFLLDAATLWAVLRALGISVSPVIAFVSFMMASAAATIAFIPGGLGFFEGTSTAMLLLFSVPPEGAIAASVLLRGFTYWLPMIPGLIIFRREMREENGNTPRKISGE